MNAVLNWVVRQFEFLFLWGPRFFGAGSFALIGATISFISQSRSVTPAAIAGVTPLPAAPLFQGSPRDTFDSQKPHRGVDPPPLAPVRATVMHDRCAQHAEATRSAHACTS